MENKSELNWNLVRQRRTTSLKMQYIRNELLYYLLRILSYATASYVRCGGRVWMEFTRRRYGSFRIFVQSNHRNGIFADNILMIRKIFSFRLNTFL